ncbi:MAG: RNA 2'-phosphotransferase [Desulfobacterales bacterium]
MNHKKQMQQLAKLLSYILEKRPDEFGLIPDDKGYVSIKELLKAISETDSWRHIRRTSIKELMLSEVDCPVEIHENRIRGKNREDLPSARICKQPPKTLYTAIRKKAYPIVAEKGISPRADTPVICWSDRKTAERLGKRKDNDPVVLTIHTDKAVQKEVKFLQFGESLFLADFIPAETFSGLPLPKMPEKAKQEEKGKKEKIKDQKKKTEGGSYQVEPKHIDPLRTEEPKSKKGKGKKKDPSWKKEQRKNRRR